MVSFLFTIILTMIWHIKVHFWEYLVIRLFPKAGPNTQLRFEQGTFWFWSWHSIPLCYSPYLGDDQWVWRNLLVALCYPEGEVCLERLGVGGNYEKIQYYIEWFSKKVRNICQNGHKKTKTWYHLHSVFFFKIISLPGIIKRYFWAHFGVYPSISWV